jgi:hypothetical protein
MRFPGCQMLQDALIIGAKFDADVHGESCRLAFYGRISTLIDPARQGDLASIRIYKVCCLLVADSSLPEVAQSTQPGALVGSKVCV